MLASSRFVCVKTHFPPRGLSPSFGTSWTASMKRQRSQKRLNVLQILIKWNVFGVVKYRVGTTCGIRLALMFLFDDFVLLPCVIVGGIWVSFMSQKLCNISPNYKHRIIYWSKYFSKS